MHSSLPTLHILSAPGRETQLARTLASLRASDWPGEAVIHTDRGAADAEPRLRQIAAWHEMLETATRAPAPVYSPLARARAAAAAVAPWRVSSDDQREAFEASRAALRQIARSPVAALQGPQTLLIIEDDALFHPRIAARLSEWPPFTRGCIRTFASLQHNSTQRDSTGMHGATWFASSASSWTGGQALLITLSFAAHCLSRWSQFPGIAHSRRLAAISARDYPTAPVWVHVPSLVEPSGEAAAWAAQGATLETARVAS